MPDARDGDLTTADAACTDDLVHGDHVAPMVREATRIAPDSTVTSRNGSTRHQRLLHGRRMGRAAQPIENLGAIRVERLHNRSRLVIRCSTEGCEEWSSSGAAINSPPEHATKVFRNRGWDVDSKNEHATCPKCQENARMKPVTPSPAAFGGQARCGSCWRSI